MPIIQKDTLKLGDNIFVTVETHPNTDVPQYYPRHTASAGTDVLFLCDLHDKNYTPTPEQKTRLLEHIQTKKKWAYVRPLKDRVREG